MLCRPPGGDSDASRASVADCYFIAFDDNRNLPHAVRIPQHLFQLFAIFVNIEILRPVPEDRNGLLGKWSTALAEDNNLFRHKNPPDRSIKF
jgi:hypothetical protein